ncbi:MAG: carboxy terminal-processing peptidase [Bacteroidia bacterium]
MKSRKLLLIIMPMLFVVFGFYLKSRDAGEDILLQAITQNLADQHYDPVQVDDKFSEKVFDLYIENLDPNKRLFLASDVEKMEKYKEEIDDQTLSGSYEFFDLSLEILEKRIELTEGFFTSILSKPFDFNLNEEVEFGDEIPYVETESELENRWRKYLKYNVLTRLHSSMEAQKNKKDSGAVVLSFDSLETKARNGVLKTHEDWYKRLKRLDRKDRVSIYVNSLTAVYDPHTNYYPPKDKENFDIQMSGRLEGIGAQLQEKDGYIKVTRIVPGGPASLQGELKENDLILKVAQENEEAVEIIDWKIDEAVKLIRGKKGTIVTLTVRKPDGSVKDIKITRDVVVLEETYAKSLIIKDEDEHSAGYIFLPSFYADFGNPLGRFSWKDVKAEVEKLKNEGVNGIIIDLRNNGGGSLDDVVKMAGLFIDQGPVVQIKEKGRRAHVMRDTREGIEWDGALVIMVNEFSASASEILAAAMQDYGRAIIIGSAKTHGKGTVQRFLDLNQSFRSKNLPRLGHIKLTTQKFYRINGDATQLKGVSSDVLTPDFYMYIETGEKEHDHPLNWDQIESSDYKKTNSVPKKLVAKSKKRIGSSETFSLIEENATRWKLQQEDNSYTLQYSSYANEKASEKQEDKKYNSIMKDSIPGFIALNPSVDAEYISEEESRAKRNKDWMNNVVKDPYIYEALQIIQDWVN